MRIPFGPVAVKALEDEDFRRALLNRPEAALRRAFGIEVPKGHELRAVEDTDEVVHLVVPAEPGSRGAEVGIVGAVLHQMRIDDEFRKAVMQRPRETFERMTSVRLPDKVEFRVLRDTDDLTYIPVPPLNPNRLLAEAAQEAAEESYGGNGGGTWSGEPPLEESFDVECTSILGNNSSQAICCQSQSSFPNTPSAFDCCPSTETPEGGPGDPILMPF